MKWYGFVFGMICMLATGLGYAANSVLLEVPSRKGVLYGLVSEDGKLLAPPIYRQLLHEPEEEIWAVQGQDYKWGFVRPDGTLAHPVNLEYARSLATGLARFDLDGRWGYLNATGKYAIEPRFDKASYFANGFAAVKTGDQWGYIDVTGEQTIQPTYYEAGAFSEQGLAVVRVKEGEPAGVIDREGNWVIKPGFQAIGFFSPNNRAPAKQDGKWGIIDQSGDWVLEPSYDNMGWFKDGITKVGRLYQEPMALLDESGKVLVSNESSYDHLFFNAECERVIAANFDAQRFNFLDAAGKPVASFTDKKFKFATGFNRNCQSLVARQFDRWSLVDADGKQVDLDQQVLEPHSLVWDVDGSNNGVGGKGQWLPVILKDKSLAYVDQTGALRLQTRIEQGSENDSLIVSDAQGKELWRHEYPTGEYFSGSNWVAFFNRDDQDIGFVDTSDTIKDKIQQLQQAAPSMIDIDDPDRSGDVYASGVSLAAIHYDFEHRYRHYYGLPNLDPQFEQVRGWLASSYGDELTADDELLERLEEAEVWAEDLAVWSINDSLLVLVKRLSEESDFYYEHVNLLLLPGGDAKQADNPLSVVGPDQLKLAEVSSSAVTKAIAQLTENIGEGDREESLSLLNKANSVLDLAQKEPISAVDYIWTQYALLQATYGDQDELQLGDAATILELADTLMTFIEANGLGEDPLSDEGQFKVHAYRYAANVAAWVNREENSEQALKLIEKALPYINDQQRYMFDTYIRVLLALGDKERAYSVIRQQLAEHPWFEYLEEFYDDKTYRRWLRRQENLNPLADTRDFIGGKTVFDEQRITVHSASKRLAVYWHNTLQMFDLDTGERLWQVDAGTASPFELRFSVDGKRLVSSGWDRVSVWNVADGDRIAKIKNREGNSECAAFSPDGNVLAYHAGDMIQTLQFYSLKDKDSIGFVAGGGSGCNVSADGKLISVSQRTDEGNQIALAEIGSGRSKAVLSGDAADAYDDDVFFVEGNQSFLVRDSSRFHLWDIDKQEVKTSWDTDMDVDNVAVSDRFMLALDGDAKTIAVWQFDQQPGEPRSLALSEAALQRSDGVSGGIVDFRLSEDQKNYVVVAYNRMQTLSLIYVFDTKTHQLIHEFATPYNVWQAYFVGNNQKLVLNSYPVQVVDLAEQKVLIEVDNRFDDR